MQYNNVFGKQNLCEQSIKKAVNERRCKSKKSKGRIEDKGTKYHRSPVTSQEAGDNISQSNFGNMVGVFQRRRARRFCYISRMG